MKRLIGFCSLLFSVLGFGNSEMRQSHEQNISQTICLTYGILTQAPEIIKFESGEKIYIRDEAVHKDSGGDLGGFVDLDRENHVYLPYLLSDHLGFYTSVLRNFWSKAFYQRCNNCHHEWEAKWHEFKCPRCQSSDFSNVPS